MNPLSALASGLAWLAIVGISCLGWQLLRQNGRLLLRLDELEKRLDEIEFGEGEEQAGLPVGSEAPGFELPDLAGEIKSLVRYRGQPLLLIFLNPACGFCRELLPKLSVFSPSPPPEERDGLSSKGLATEGERRPFDAKPQLLIISTGGAEANRELFNEPPINSPVLLQKASEVADAYKAMGTPSGYLVNAEGKIASRLVMGGDALLTLLEQKPESAKQDQELSGAASSNGEVGEEARGNRFSSRSLARSKIKRDGLKAGTPAPDFRLPRLDGRGDLTLSELRGRQVFLVFSSPGCGPCNSLAPELEKFHRRNVAGARSPSPGGEGRGLSRHSVPATADEGEPSLPLQVIIISKGEPKENRAKVKEHGLTFPVALQQQWEISRRYAMFATPSAYLIDEKGVITHDVAVGTDAIMGLIARPEGVETSAEAGRATICQQSIIIPVRFSAFSFCTRW